MASIGASCVSRVLIPSDLHKMIQNIREIFANKHSEDDIYGLLEGSNMDPDETVRKLLKIEEERSMMESGSVGVVGGGGILTGARVPIPKSLRKTILDIKEIAAGKHSDDDIYAVLKECNMDPNETVQKLLYLDTFHEVKSKKDKKNVNVGRAAEVQGSSSMPRRGARGGRGSSSNVSDDSGRRRQVSARQESGTTTYAKRSVKPSVAFVQKRDKTPAPVAPKSEGVTPAVVVPSTAKQVHGPSEVMVSRAEAVAFEYNVPSPPKSDVAVQDQATPELERKLEKLSISTHQPVIFPVHLQVPEALRKGLTFGSLEAVSTLPTEIVSGSGLPASEPAQSCPPSLPEETEKSSTFGDNASSGAAPKSDQSEQEIPAPIGGSQYPLLPTAPDYNFGFSPSVTGPQPVHLEGSELQGDISTAPSTSGSTQQSGVEQSSFPFPPQLLPYLRPPYPPNFIPYNPYFPHLYMPHNPHPYLGHIPANMHIPAAAAAAAATLPVPAMYNAGTFAGSMAHFGVPSGYGSYGTSGVGYSHSPPLNSGSSDGVEDLAAAELNDANIYTALQQNEEVQGWNSAAGQDLSAWQANYFYNIQPGQRVVFPPGHAGHGPFPPGVYHPHGNLAASSSGQSLPQPSPAAAGSTEPAVPSSTYQQPHPHPHPHPHPQFHWNSRTLSRENI